MNDWYELDNAGKLFTSVTGSKNTSVFRISAILSEPVNGEALQKAATHVLPRYPMLFARMRQGVFWNYLDSNHEAFHVQEETEPPCTIIHPAQNNGYYLRLLYYGHRISVEVFHSLTDGSGAIEYLKSVLHYYFQFTGCPVAHEGKILLADGIVPPENVEDSFAAYYKEMKVPPHDEPVAYHLTGTPFEQGGNHVTTGVVNASELNRRAKASGATITAYLAAGMILSIHQTRLMQPDASAPVIVAVPVNLRKPFPSQTLRNFFGVVNVGMPVLKNTRFEEILHTVIAQLKEKTTKESLQAYITGNMQLEKNLPARMAPLKLKQPVVNMGFNLLGESKKSISISNLGIVTLPREMAPLVRHMEVVLYPTPKSPVNVGVISVNDKLSINFSRSIRESRLPQRFFRLLAEDGGLDVSVYSNEWGQPYDSL